MPPKPHLRIAYDDLDRLRADVCALLDAGEYVIDWAHIDVRGHDVDEAKVVRALRAGDYLQSRYPARYLAEHVEPDAVEIRVVFEVRPDEAGRRVVVVTAYPLEEL